MSDDLLVELARSVDGLEPDAMRVLIAIAKRLQKGQAEYGKMDLAADARDFRREGCEELLDFVVYETMARLASEVRG